MKQDSAFTTQEQTLKRLHFIFIVFFPLTRIRKIAFNESHKNLSKVKLGKVFGVENIFP